MVAAQCDVGWRGRRTNRGTCRMVRFGQFSPLMPLHVEEMSFDRPGYLDPSAGKLQPPAPSTSANCSEVARDDVATPATTKVEGNLRRKPGASLT